MNGMIRGCVLKQVSDCFNCVVREGKVQIIQDENNVLAKWVCQGLGENFDWVGDNYTIGFVQNNRLLGALIFHNLRPKCEVWWTIYTVDKHWCTLSVLKYIFMVAFDGLKCRRISLLVSRSNVKCLSLVKRLGFKIEGCLRQYRDNGEDAFILSMLNNECKWSL